MKTFKQYLEDTDTVRRNLNISSDTWDKAIKNQVLYYANIKVDNDILSPTPVVIISKPFDKNGEEYVRVKVKTSINNQLNIRKIGDKEFQSPKMKDKIMEIPLNSILFFGFNGVS